MQVTIHGQGVGISEPLEAHAERRVGFAVGRFRERVELVEIQLADVNGPRGGEDLECRLLVRIPGQPSVVVRATGIDAYATVDRAAAKASMAIARHFGRRRAISRRAPVSRAT